MPGFLQAANGLKGVGSWGPVSETYTKSREAIAAAMGAAIGLSGAFLNLIKFDIIRDFFQNIGLFFGNIASGALEAAKDVWGNVSNLISFDITSISDSVDPTVIYIILAVVIGLLFCGFCCLMCATSDMTTDRIRHGHEVVTWEDRQQTSKKKLMLVKFGLMAATSAYLPVSRTLIEIMSCAPTMAKLIIEWGGVDAITCTTTENNLPDCNCKEWKNYNGILVVAVILLISYTVALPIYCYRLIKKNKPFGSLEDPTKCYDEEGRLVDYDDDRYQDDLKLDPNQVNCPYLFMYKGYERKWAFYKVWMMVMKFALVIPVVIWYDSVVVQSIVCLVVLFIMSIMSFYSTPFLDVHDDIMDSSGRVSALLTLLFALIGSDNVSPGSSSVMGALVQVCNYVNILIMGLMTFWGFTIVRRFIKNMTGQIEFSDSVKDTTGPAHRIIPYWDIQSEVKRRVWHTFWEATLISISNDVAKRLRDIQFSARNSGKKRILQHVANATNPAITNAREFSVNHLEGVDVYWDGETNDGQLDSSTRFGKMYVVSYPFHCVMVYDDSDDYTFVWEDKLLEFVARNQDPEIRRRRLIRQKLRALVGETITYHLKQWETHRVEDGTETYKDSEGNERTRTVYSNVRVLMTYSKGVISIGANNDLRMAAGFQFKLTLTDGTGVGIAPRTGRRHNIHGSTSKSLESLKIGPTFQYGHSLRQIFNNYPNREIWPSKLTEWDTVCDTYRDDLAKERRANEDTLSASFWLHVYDNDMAAREEIETYLSSFETNPDVQAIPETHKDGLDFLFERMTFINSHPCAALWYIFWADVWESNMEMSRIKKHETLLNPASPDAIAYTPMDRPTLETKLTEMNLLSSWRYVKNRCLDTLYSMIESHEVETDELEAMGGLKHPDLQPISGAGGADADFSTTNPIRRTQEEAEEENIPQDAPADEEKAESEKEPADSEQTTVNAADIHADDQPESNTKSEANESAKAMAFDVEQGPVVTGAYIPAGSRRGHAAIPAHKRREAPSNLVVRESIAGMARGEVRNIASARSRFAYTPRDPQELEPDDEPVEEASEPENAE